jgi:hypothetical protein
MGRLNAILQDRHDRALATFKASNKSWWQKSIEADKARSDEKSEHQKTHERFNPGGRAIIAAMNKGDE